MKIATTDKRGNNRRRSHWAHCAHVELTSMAVHRGRMARGVSHPYDLPLLSSAGKPTPSLHLSSTNSRTRGQKLTIPRWEPWCRICKSNANERNPTKIASSRVVPALLCALLLVALQLFDYSALPAALL